MKHRTVEPEFGPSILKPSEQKNPNISIEFTAQNSKNPFFPLTAFKFSLNLRIWIPSKPFKVPLLLFCTQTFLVKKMDEEQQWLINCLNATLDTDQKVRSFAETSLHQASLQSGLHLFTNSRTKSRAFYVKLWTHVNSFTF